MANEMPVKKRKTRLKDRRSAIDLWLGLEETE